MEKQFPIINADKYNNCPASIPWSLIEPHAAQAEKFHGQTLETLAERGGLNPMEIIAVLHDKNYYEYWQGVPNAAGLALIKLNRFLNPQSPPATATVIKKKNE